MNWYDNEKIVKIKDNKVVVKLYNGDQFIDSCVIPTAYYPLNGKLRVFTHENTKRVTDEKVLQVFNSVKYQIGHCYQNTISLVQAMQDADITVKTYVGWLFLSNSQYPVHHCWAVINDESILDLSDDYTTMLSVENGKMFENKNKQEQAMLMADFHKAARTQLNSVRCYPVGTPTPFFFYVGCECDGESGRALYRKLMREFPDHKVERNCDSRGLNQTQKILYEQGLI